MLKTSSILYSLEFNLTNEETLFLSVYQQLLAEGYEPEGDIEEMTHRILDNPEDYPWYF